VLADQADHRLALALPGAASQRVPRLSEAEQLVQDVVFLGVAWLAARRVGPRRCRHGRGMGGADIRLLSRSFPPP
jgi:hypothetical protein